MPELLLLLLLVLLMLFVLLLLMLLVLELLLLMLLVLELLLLLYWLLFCWFDDPPAPHTVISLGPSGSEANITGTTPSTHGPAVHGNSDSDTQAASEAVQKAAIW